MITVSASQPFSAGRLAIALSYGIGSAVVLYFLMLGGRRAIAPLAKRGIGLQVAMGAVMVLVAPGDARQLRHPLPEPRSPPTCRASSSTPAKRLEESASAQDALTELRGHGAKFAATRRPAPGMKPAVPSCRYSAGRRNSSATSAGSTPPATGR